MVVRPVLAAAQNKGDRTIVIHGKERLGAGGSHGHAMAHGRLQYSLTVIAGDGVGAVRFSTVCRDIYFHHGCYMIVIKGDPAPVFSVALAAVFAVTHGDHIAGRQGQGDGFSGHRAGNHIYLPRILQNEQFVKVLLAGNTVCQCQTTCILCIDLNFGGRIVRFIV